MDRGANYRVMYIIMYMALIFLSFTYSIRSILQGLKLSVIIINCLSMIFINSFMFGLIYWQYPKNLGEKVEKHVYHLRFTKQLDLQQQKQPKRNINEMGQKQQSLPKKDELVITKKNNKEKLIQTLKNAFTGTDVIKVGWINILYMAGENILTYCLFTSIRLIFASNYTLIWAIISIFYCIGMVIILIFPIKKYTKTVFNKMVEDEIKLIDEM